MTLFAFPWRFSVLCGCVMNYPSYGRAVYRNVLMCVVSACVWEQNGCLPFPKLPWHLSAADTKNHTQTHSHTHTLNQASSTMTTNSSFNTPSDARPLLMFVDTSQRSWQISADVLDCLSRQINQERATVTGPLHRYYILWRLLCCFLWSRVLIYSISGFPADSVI